MKSTLKELFPTIDLGIGKTFHNLLHHIVGLKSNLVARTKKSFTPTEMVQTLQIKANNSYKALENSKLVTSLKNVAKFKDDFS